jgi:chromatin segregation and condensation protein Rec8/ScpA/Scc1 (kleisin family)
MKREDLLKEMKESVGTKDPLEFFSKLPDVLTLLFDRIDQLENTLDRVKRQSALAINWEPKVAADMLAKQVQVLRQDKDTYANEITALKQAFAEDKVTQSYQEFTRFWETTLGWHPFLD